MALTMTITGASAVFAEGETLSVATDFGLRLWYRGLHPGECIYGTEPGRRRSVRMDEEQPAAAAFFAIPTR